MKPLIVVAAAALATVPAFAVETSQVSQSVDTGSPELKDSLIAPQGHFAGSVATGLPYLAIGEVAYGITNRFTAGVVAGVTPNTQGVGVRLRGVIVDGDTDRLIVSSPFFYYPAAKSEGNEPWVLIMPEVLFEHRFANSARVHAGLGLAAATCTPSIAAAFAGKPGDADTGFMGDLWATAKIGGSYALGQSTSLFADFTLVTPGLLLGHGWIVGAPLVATVGIEHTF